MVQSSSLAVEDIDPGAYADGVLYVPEWIELQPRQHFWGHPARPELRELIAKDRPHGVGGRKLLCLLCMRLRAARGLPPAPVWMTFVESPSGPVFRHEDGQQPHQEHTPESDTHKALKEREASAWEQAGAQVRVEQWRPRAKRRPDVLAVRAGLTVAGEVQHTTIPPEVVGRRQKALAAEGDRVVWTTDRDAADVAFLRRVPHLSVPALDDHRMYQRSRTPLLNVVTGWTFFEAQRCGWADTWRGTSRCPVSGRAMPCGKLHLYPTLNVKEYKASADAMFPFGETVHLDHLLEGILNELWVPYRAAQNRTTWVPADAYEKVVDERGEFAEGAGLGRVPPRRRQAGRVCEQNAAATAAAAAMAPPVLPGQRVAGQDVLPGVGDRRGGPTAPPPQMFAVPSSPPAPASSALSTQPVATATPEPSVPPAQESGAYRRRVIIPGTLPVEGATLALAAANMLAFADAVRGQAVLEGEVRGYTPDVGESIRDEVADHPEAGRFAWVLPVNGRDQRILMPGADLAALKGLSASAPCLQVNGSWWWWNDAVTSAVPLPARQPWLEAGITRGRAEPV